MAIQIRYQTLLYTGSMPRSVFMQIMHENHEFVCAKINAIDFVCINCCWNEVRVNSNDMFGNLLKQVRNGLTVDKV